MTQKSCTEYSVPGSTPTQRYVFLLSKACHPERERGQQASQSAAHQERRHRMLTYPAHIRKHRHTRARAHAQQHLRQQRQCPTSTSILTLRCSLSHWLSTWIHTRTSTDSDTRAQCRPCRTRRARCGARHPTQTAGPSRASPAPTSPSQTPA